MNTPGVVRMPFGEPIVLRRECISQSWQRLVGRGGDGKTKVQRQAERNRGAVQWR